LKDLLKRSAAAQAAGKVCSIIWLYAFLIEPKKSVCHFPYIMNEDRDTPNSCFAMQWTERTLTILFHNLCGSGLQRAVSTIPYNCQKPDCSDSQ